MTNKGEVLAYQYLINNGYTVEDVSNNSDFYDKDIDFIATQEGKSHTIQVKWDNRIHETGNMFIQISTDIDNGKDGWFKFCKADYLYYGDSFNKLFYIIKMSDLKDFIHNNMCDERNAADYTFNGRLKKISRGAIIPIKKISSMYPVTTAKL